MAICLKAKRCNTTSPMGVQAGVQPLGVGGGEVEIGVEVASAANGAPTGMANPHVRKF